MEHLSGKGIRDRILTESFSSPLIFDNFTNHWPCRHWTPEWFGSTSDLSDIKLLFRIGKNDVPRPKQVTPQPNVQWEKNCRYVESTLAEFWRHLSGESTDSPFSNLSGDEWAYADYKHMAELFQGHTELLGDVNWSAFGFPELNGQQTTFWLGTEGAYTPCHYDSYGANLVAQIYGRKKWILFRPEDTTNLYPTRVPFEESSVFSEVNIQQPNLDKHSRYMNAGRYEVTLRPGQVLYVPKHWWHYVECESTALSLNTWISLESDKNDRIEEGLATLLVSALVKASSQDPSDYYNPKEAPVGYEEAEELLEMTIQRGERDRRGDNDPPELQELCSCCEMKITEIKPSKTDQNEKVKIQSVRERDRLELKQIINYVTHPKTLSCITNLIKSDRKIK